MPDIYTVTKLPLNFAASTKESCISDLPRRDFVVKEVTDIKLK